MMGVQRIEMVTQPRGTMAVRTVGMTRLRVIAVQSSLRAQREVVEVRRWAVDIERKLKESTAKVKKLETELV